MKTFKFPLVIVPPVVSGILSFSLITTVILFFITADNADHLPALSEAAVYLPGKYIFTLSIVISGFLLFVMSLVLYYALCQRASQVEQLLITNGSGSGSQQQHYSSSSRVIMCCFGCFRLRWLNAVSCLFVALSSFGLTGLGLVPLVEGDPSQLSDITSGKEISGTKAYVTLFHLACSGLFFSAMYAHMWLNLISSFWTDRKWKILGQAPLNSFVWRVFGVSAWTVYRFLCCISVILSIVFVQVASAVAVIANCSVQEIEQQTCAAMNAANKYGALVQYLMISFIIVYMISFVYEMKGLHVHVKLDEITSPTTTNRPDDIEERELLDEDQRDETISMENITMEERHEDDL